MVRIEEIIIAARQLAPADRAELLRRLLLESTSADDDVAAGERGLAALTESMRREDWSQHYPQSLKRQRRAG